MTAVALSVAASGLTAINAAEQQLNPKAISIKLPHQGLTGAHPPYALSVPGGLSASLSDEGCCCCCCWAGGCCAG
jgi:hypothetical protein